MFLPWPLTTSVELAQVLRPGGHLRSDSALRALRDRGLAAESIMVVPRSGRGAHGRAVWYSSLMIDVARLVRTGDDETAVAAHDAATGLASHRAAHHIAGWLVEPGGPDPDPAVLDAKTGGALTRLATLTASARQALLPGLGVETFAGRVGKSRGHVASVIDERGRELPLPAPTGSPSRWAAGTVVVVDTEVLPGGATTVWVRAGFDSEADPNERVPGGPQLLTPAESMRVARATASAR